MARRLRKHFLVEFDAGLRFKNLHFSRLKWRLIPRRRQRKTAVLFKNELHEQFGTWPLAFISSGGPEFGEIAAVAKAVGDGDDAVFYQAWMDAGDRLRSQALQASKEGHRAGARDPGAGRGERKKMVSPLHKRRAVAQVVTAGLCSQRRACRYLGLHRSSGRYPNKGPTEWQLRLGERLEALSRKPKGVSSLI